MPYLLPEEEYEMAARAAAGVDTPVNGHRGTYETIPDDLLAEETPSTLRLRWVHHAFAAPPPEPPWLVDGLIRRGELAVFGAARGVGKSWMGMNLATLLSRGEGRFLGQIPVTRPATTLYNQGELDEWSSYQRWLMLTGSGAPPQRVAETFDRWRLRTVTRRQQTTNKVDGTVMTDSDEFIDATLDGRVEATVAEHGIDVIIIDPWATYFAGKENSNDETEAALDKLRDLTLRYGTSIVIFAHFGKSNDVRDPEDLWRGASRLADWASTRVSLLLHYTEKQAQDQNMTRQQARRFIDVKFLRRGEPIDDFSIAWNPATGWWERWISPAEHGANAPQPNRFDVTVHQIVEACENSGGAWTSITKAAEALGVGDHTAKKYCEWATREGALEPWRAPRGATGYRVPVDQITEF